MQVSDSWDSTVGIFSRPHVWQLRLYSLILDRVRGFPLLQCVCASSGSHPATCSVGMGVARHEADNSCPFTLVLRLNMCVCVCVCVCICVGGVGWGGLNFHSPEWLYGTHTETTLQIPGCTQILNYIPVWRVAFTHLLLSSVGICISWTQMTVFFFLELVDWLLQLSAGLYEPH